MVILSTLKQYQDCLEEAFWELHESAYRLCGVTEFAFKRILGPEEAALLKRDCFGGGPSFCLERSALRKNSHILEQYEHMLKNLVEAIQKRKMHALKLKIEAFSYDESDLVYSLPYLRDHTYFVRPCEAIYFAASNGSSIPLELQRASGIFQIPRNATVPLSKGQINDVKKDVIAQVYWSKFPREKTISGMCRRIDELREIKGFEFLANSNGGTNMKARAPVNKMKPNPEGEIVWIREVIQADKGIIKIDFQRLKVVFEVIMRLKLLRHKTIQLEEFLAEPLINLYISNMGSWGKKLVRLCVKDVLDDLGFKCD